MALSRAVIADQPGPRLLVGIFRRSRRRGQRGPGADASANQDTARWRDVVITPAGTLTEAAHLKLFVSQSSGFSLAAEAPLSSQSATLTVDRPISTTPLRAMVSLSLAPEAPALTWIRLTLSGLGVEVPDGIQGPPLTGPSLSVRDGEIPSTPVVELGSRFIKSKGLLAARWESRVPRSVIEEYRVGVGISSDPSVYEGSDAFAALAFRGDGYGVSSRGTHVGPRPGVLRRRQGQSAAGNGAPWG